MSCLRLSLAAPVGLLGHMDPSLEVSKDLLTVYGIVQRGFGLFFSCLLLSWRPWLWGRLWSSLLGFSSRCLALALALSSTSPLAASSDVRSELVWALFGAPLLGAFGGCWALFGSPGTLLALLGAFGSWALLAASGRFWASRMTASTEHAPSPPRVCGD